MLHMNCGVCIGKIFPTLVFVLATFPVHGSLEAESCEGTSENGGGAGLLQAGQAHKGGPDRSLVQMPLGVARSILSPTMFDLGMQLLQHEETLDTFVDKTFGTSFDYPWTQGSAVQMKTVSEMQHPHSTRRKIFTV
jgi:hypothetical protein